MTSFKRQHTKTLPPLNLGQVFRFFIIGDKIATLNEETGKVWLGYDLNLTEVENIEQYKEVKLLSIPEKYGCEKEAVIGGIGKTKRVIGVIKGSKDYEKINGKCFVDFYATNVTNYEDFKRRVLKIIKMSKSDYFNKIDKNSEKIICSPDNTIKLITSKLAKLVK